MSLAESIMKKPDAIVMFQAMFVDVCSSGGSYDDMLGIITCWEQMEPVRVDMMLAVAEREAMLVRRRLCMRAVLEEIMTTPRALRVAFADRDPETVFTELGY